MVVMVVMVLKWLKETRFYEGKKEIIITTRTLHERKVHIKKKGRVYEITDNGKVDITDFCEEKGFFFTVGSWWNDDLSLVFTKPALCFKK